ncbi:MAG: uroporphyrinogen decarboxylase family protein [Acidobacteriota bacterium]
MTGRERILAAFRGEQPDAVPFAPNIYHWFYSRQRNGTLPPELAAARHPFDALRRLGADILARWDTQRATREVYTAGEYSEEYLGASDLREPVTTAFNIYPPGRTERRRRFVTPYGTLTHCWTYMTEAGVDFESEFWWKDWSEYEAVRFMLEATEYVFDAGEFHRWVEKAGDDGLVMVHLTESPLKTFHWLAGAPAASLFMIDHPEEMQALARIHERKALALLERVADNPEAEIFVSLDNLDSVFYPPYFYRDYCHDFFARAAGIIHRRGKIFVVHACGQNRVLLPLVGRNGVDCLEGITPPPTGNVDLSQARGLSGYENFTVNGGMDVTRQETAADPEARIHDYTRRLFESMGDKRHFIFASSCSTSVLTPWENLVHFRDAAREYGRV